MQDAYYAVMVLLSEATGKRAKILKNVAVGYRQEMEVSDSEGAPIPSTLQALCKAAHTRILGTLGWCRSLDWNSRSTISRALAVGAACTKVLPLAERAVAAIAGAMQFAIRVEACKLIETDLLGRVLPAEDATALPAVVAALEEAEGLCARRRRAYCGGAVDLKRCVSTIGLERFKSKDPN